MVPLSDTLGRSIGAELSNIASKLLGDWRAESPEAGLVEWAAAASGTILRFDAKSFAAPEIPEPRWHEAPVLAAVGYRMQTATLPTEVEERWLDGVTRLMSRDAVPPDRNSFFFRPAELLGIAIGASVLRMRDATPSAWLSALISSQGGLLQAGLVWPTVLTTLAARQIDNAWSSPARFDPESTLDTGTLFWLHLIDTDLAASVTAADRDQLCRRLLKDASQEPVHVQGLGPAGIVWIALERAVLTALDGLELRAASAADFVLTLCRRFPLLAGELTRRHGGRPSLIIADEYDVQDALRALLRAHFDDVRPEEWNPSYGGVSSRSDLLIKSERVVIETKMTRKNLGQREVIAELTVDKAQYRTHPDCETLVCFVYDPDKRLSNPTALESDLSSVEPGLTTQVVVSPRGL